jgi:CHAT domain-containing protein
MPARAQSADDFEAQFHTPRWRLYELRVAGNYAEATAVAKRWLEQVEHEKGYEDAQVAVVLDELALLYQIQGRYTEAIPILERSLAIYEHAYGPNHEFVAISLSNLAVGLQGSGGRRAEALKLLERSVAIYDSLKTDTLNSIQLDSFAGSLGNLGVAYARQGRYAEAEPLLKRSIAMVDQPGSGLPPYEQCNALAELYTMQGRYVEAETLLRRFPFDVFKKSLGPDHPEIADQFARFAELYLAQSKWDLAIDYSRKATSMIVHRIKRGSAIDTTLTAKGTEVGPNRYKFLQLVKIAHRLANQRSKVRAGLADEMFETAQWAQASEAADSLAQMAVRAAVGNAAVAELARERQNLVEEWRTRERLHSAAISEAVDRRDREAASVTRFAAIASRVAEIDRRLKADFPDYAALSSPEPLSVKQVQADLQPDEALVLFLDMPEWKPTPEETFIWVVTKTDSRWVRSELGTPSLKHEVAALRCGLDYDGAWGALDSRCQDLLKASYTEIDHKMKRSLPFDRERAHALYKALFAPIEEVIKDKQLLVVPSGALTQLPFQVLVTEKPDAAARGKNAFRHTAWLVRKHALTVLPSVSSLMALRQLAKDSHASRAMIGFGNPLLDGPDASYGRWVAAARSKQFCPAVPEQRVAVLTSDRRGLLPFKLSSGLADVTEIRVQIPLPETADELCAVARDLRVNSDDIRLGARATEAEIKRLSEAGELSKYRIIHFATHGALAGQVSGNSEPGLLLTPPDTATEIDDGYLSASEIAALKLDADWVVLSACNTAAGGADGAEALSGLARAFFYAGARALLVSHWAVDSDATVKLITGAVGRMAADKGVGRGEAMRQSMLALIDKGTDDEAHPAYWAPFVVVGEGAAVK